MDNSNDTININLTEPLVSTSQSQSSPQEQQFHVAQKQVDVEIINTDEDDDSTVPTALGLLFYKSLFFLSGLSASTWGRFGVIFYNRVANLNPFQIGILQGVMPLVSLVTTPCWGIMADCIYSRKRVYLFCNIVNTFCLLTLALIKKPTFLSILICVSGMSFFTASGVLDAFVLDYLGERYRSKYGTVRLWASISWGLGAFIMGFVTDMYGFQWNFVLYVSMMFTNIGIVWYGLPARSKSEQERYDVQHSNSIDSDSATDVSFSRRSILQGVLKEVICRPVVIVWLFQVIVIGAAMSLVDSFLFVYLQNDLSASTKLCGTTVGVTVIFEIPIFYYSKWLLSHVGHDMLFIISMIAYSTRVFGYTLLTKDTVYWILPLEILHGVTYACMWIASVDFACRVSPAEWSTTVQAILSASFGCFGYFIGSIVGGWVLQNYSAVVMYRGMGSIIVVILMLHLVIWVLFRKGYNRFLEKYEQDCVVTPRDNQESLLTTNKNSKIDIVNV